MTASSREIITINVGGCGVNLGQCALQQYCVEQGISSTGERLSDTLHKEVDTASISFQETASGAYLARSIFIDLDPLPIHCLQNMFSYSGVIHSNYMLHGKSSASYNWADGNIIAGKEIISDVTHALRLAIEECDNFQGFLINHSLAGGTGGGFTSFLLERLNVDYQKKAKFTCSVLPHDNRWAALQIYGALLTLSCCLQNADVSIMLNNDQIHDEICKQLLNIRTPRFKHYNNVYCKYLSNITAPLRFAANQSLQSFAMDMVPFPKLHFLTSSMSPIVPTRCDQKQKGRGDGDGDGDELKHDDQLQELTNECLQWNHFTHSRSDFQVQRDKYLAMSFVYRGHDMKQNVLRINNAVQASCREGLFRCAPAMSSNRPTVKIVNNALAALDEDCMRVDGKASVSLIANNICVLRDIKQRIIRRKEILYDAIRGAFITQLVAFAMEEGELWEASETLQACINDYKDVVSGNMIDI